MRLAHTESFSKSWEKGKEEHLGLEHSCTDAVLPFPAARPGRDRPGPPRPHPPGKTPLQVWRETLGHCPTGEDPPPLEADLASRSSSVLSLGSARLQQGCTWDSSPAGARGRVGNSLSLQDDVSEGPLGRRPKAAFSEKHLQS